jgi:hypothetical protein
MINWTINWDCFVAAYNGNRFELGEMGKGYWILKHWKDKPQSNWYKMKSQQEGFDKAMELVQ